MRPLLPWLLASILLVPAGAFAAEVAAPVIFGTVDVYYGLNLNRPPERESFTGGYGSSVRRANEFGLNLAALGAKQEPAPVGFTLILQAGTAANFVHLGEPVGSGIGPAVFEHVQQASVAWKAADPLLLEAGIYPSHIGYEVFQAKDNWLTTRGLMAELSPYYQTGAKATYTATDHLSAQLHVLNGWQIVGDNNRGKSLGAQVAWASKSFDVYLNGWGGPELPGDDDSLRFLGDVVAVVRPGERLQLAASVDYGSQQLPDAEAVAWQGVGLWARAQLAEAWAFSLRGELFRDPDGGISGAPQSLQEYTAGVELKPAAGLQLRLEGRHDRSTEDVYASRDGLTGDQTLVVLSTIASF